MLNLKTVFKGFLMGSADIVPGVSGGTVAFITGIYDPLINNISRVDHQVLKLLLQRRFKEIYNLFDVPFLLSVFTGIFTAILSLSKVIHYLIHEYQSSTYALFFGLMIGAVFIMIKPLWVNKKLNEILFLILGVLIGIGIVSLTAMNLPINYFSLFVVGIISISAMILPGISGSFLLLTFGFYHNVIGYIKSLPSLDSFINLMFFGLGCGLGLVSFSKVLKLLLAKYHSLVFALLIGFMLGALKKLWPWQDSINDKIVYNIPMVNFAVFIEIGFIFFGILAVVMIEHYTSKRGISSAG